MSLKLQLQGRDIYLSKLAKGVQYLPYRFSRALNVCQKAEQEMKSEISREMQWVCAKQADLYSSRSCIHTLEFLRLKWILYVNS